jgi:hypothetical protein
MGFVIIRCPKCKSANMHLDKVKRTIICDDCKAEHNPGYMEFHFSDLELDPGIVYVDYHALEQDDDERYLKCPQYKTYAIDMCKEIEGDGSLCEHCPRCPY